jgi:CubicO group peptidase (beta-lactamase class C family)
VRVRSRLRMVGLGLAVLGVSLFVMPASAQVGDDSGLDFGDDRLAAVESYLESAHMELELPGLAAAIVGDGEVVYSRGFGFVEKGGGQITPATPFVIASLSKSITALALLQTVDDGLVDLDAPVSVYLPELAPEGEGVTVRDLMHHRSGVSTFAGQQALVGDLGSSLEANVGRMGPLLEPGAGFEYSNLNYDAIALIVERASGMTFADFVEERIFEPLGMVNSKVAPDTSVAGFAQGHYHWILLGYRPLEAWKPQGVVGGGFMASSAEDMARLLTVHINGGMYEGHRIVSADNLSLLHEPRSYDDDTPLGYGGGWRIEPPGTEGAPEALSSYTTLWHGGDWNGYTATHWVTPEAGVGVVVLANGNDRTDQASIGFVGQNVKLILTGEETFEIPESFGDFLTVWGKHLLLALVLVQIVLALAVVPLLQRKRQGGSLGVVGKVVLGVATLIDVTALTELIWVIPTQAPFGLVASLPDYGILMLAMSAGVVWGVVRTILVVRSGLAPQPAPT